MSNLRIKGLVMTFLLLWLLPAGTMGQVEKKLEKVALSRLGDWRNPVKEWRFPEKIRIDSVKVNEDNRSLSVYFQGDLSYNPIREESLSVFRSSVERALGRKFRDYRISLIANRFELEELIPNIYRKITGIDPVRLPVTRENRPVLVRRVDNFYPVKGLDGRYIALWHSHGYYFEMSLDRWEYQRAKIFGTVEDLSIMAYVVPYLTRMLENAGATVFLPRERDIQTNEVIVDSDRSTGKSEFVIHVNDSSRQSVTEGFLLKDTLYTGENPFDKGTSLVVSRASADYVPEIPEKGDYAVYISYPRLPENSREVKYTVRHSGGTTEFVVDQTVGGDSWIYLGTFHFSEGMNAATGSVSVCSENGGQTGFDAVRFGGGMGNVARRPSGEIMANQWSVNENASSAVQKTISSTIDHSWKLSGKPRYLEAARYYLQYAGMPDTLVYSLNKSRNDYNDDYQSRGEWVNYLMATQIGPDPLTRMYGMGLPVDLTLAFHSDAGVTPDDSIIGTLGIYSTAAGNGRFPDGTSRLASRDLTDIIQTQIVEDISVMFNPEWTRRGLWDKPYSEARKPNTPSMLLELLSHQNKGDQQFGLDPRFRFHVSRAIYKGMLKYISYTSKTGYVVQPLPVSNFELTPLGGKRIRLSWEPVNDILEPSAMPEEYRIYRRTGDNGFDNGVIVKENYAEVELENYDTIYSFSVTALNKGGESFGSEILAVGIRNEEDKPVLVVNGFDRISGPAWIDRGGMAGVEWWNDRGVADKYDMVTIGDQYDFERSSPWIDDDAPGWGASYTDTEGRVTAGNTFDFPYVHGKAIMASGRSFISVSDEVFISEHFDASRYCMVDLIFGEEKSTTSVNDTAKVDFRIYTPEFVSRIEKVAEAGIPVFISGSYIGTDLSMQNDTALISRVKKTLHFFPRTGHAVRNGKIYSADIVSKQFPGVYMFCTEGSREIYGAEAPDAIEPADKSSVTCFRYSENNTSAGVASWKKNRTVALGFPFETIKSESERVKLMSQIINFLTNH